MIESSLKKRSSPSIGVKYREILVVIANPSSLTPTELRRQQKLGWHIEAPELHLYGDFNKELEVEDKELRSPIKHTREGKDRTVQKSYVCKRAKTSNR